MGFYAKHILPRFCDLAMRNPESARLRAEWVPRARGAVLEVGFGSGLNLPFYSAEVKRLYGLDPSPELLEMAAKRALASPLELDLLTQPAEDPLPLDDRSIDTVVLTWTLCSIPDPDKALQQIRRVLKPEGKLIFLEHGLAPDPGTARWQNRLTPVWARISGGCRLNLKIDDVIRSAGFRIGEFRATYLAGPHLITYTYQGIAQATATLAAGQSQPRL